MLYNIASGDSTARGKMGAKVGALGKSTVRTQRKRRWQRTWEKLCKCVLPPEIRKRVYKRNGLMKKKNKTEESQLKNLKCFKKFSRFNLRAVKIITIKYIHISIFHTCLCVCVCVKERNLRCSKNFWKKSFSRSMRRLIFLTVAPVRDLSSEICVFIFLSRQKEVKGKVFLPMSLPSSPHLPSSSLVLQIQSAYLTNDGTPLPDLCHVVNLGFPGDHLKWTPDGNSAWRQTSQRGWNDTCLAIMHLLTFGQDHLSSLLEQHLGIGKLFRLPLVV